MPMDRDQLGQVPSGSLFGGSGSAFQRVQTETNPTHPHFLTLLDFASRHLQLAMQQPTSFAQPAFLPQQIFLLQPTPIVSPPSSPIMSAFLPVSQQFDLHPRHRTSESPAIVPPRVVSPTTASNDSSIVLPRDSWTPGSEEQSTRDSVFESSVTSQPQPPPVMASLPIPSPPPPPIIVLSDDEEEEEEVLTPPRNKASPSIVQAVERDEFKCQPPDFEDLVISDFEAFFNCYPAKCVTVTWEHSPERFGCCDETYNADVRERFCANKGKGCISNVIPPFAHFWSGPKKTILCESCFEKMSPVVTDSAAKRPRFSLKHFSYCYNGTNGNEETIACTKCRCKFHLYCTLCTMEDKADNFQCPSCISAAGLPQLAIPTVEGTIPRTLLDTELENQVRNLAEQMSIPAEKFSVRVVWSNCVTFEPRAGMRSLSSSMPQRMSCITKTIFLFDKIGGYDTIVFAMFVQHYGDQAELVPAVNKRRVNIARIAVPGFLHMTAQYELIFRCLILSYFNYVRDLGYLFIHAWSRPPSNDDFFDAPVFYEPPSKEPCSNNCFTSAWLRELFRIGKELGKVKEFSPLADYASRPNFLLPYFMDDYWPIELEKMIKRLKASAAAAMNRAPALLDENRQTRRSSRSKNNGTGEVHEVANKCNEILEQLLDKEISSALQTKGDEFLVAKIGQCHRASGAPMKNDPDAKTVFCDFLKSPQHFYKRCRENSWSFGSLRRARFSTSAILSWIGDEMLSGGRTTK